jgi:hypothetical protein
MATVRRAAKPRQSKGTVSRDLVPNSRLAHWSEEEQHTRTSEKACDRFQFGYHRPLPSVACRSS